MNLGKVFERMKQHRAHLSKNGCLIQVPGPNGRRWVLKFRMRHINGWSHRTISIGQERGKLERVRELLQEFRTAEMQRDPFGWRPNLSKAGMLLSRRARRRPDGIGVPDPRLEDPLLAWRKANMPDPSRSTTPVSTEA